MQTSRDSTEIDDRSAIVMNTVSSAMAPFLSAVHIQE
jgi:hypothetical protein